jgi:DNA ligase 1
MARLAFLRDQTILWHVMEPNHIALVATTEAIDSDDLERQEAHLIEQGHEGVIARVPGSLYKHGRSGKTGPLLKIKRFVDFECVVLGTYEEQHNGNVGFTNELGRTARSTAKAGKVGKGTLGGLVLSPVDDSVVPSDVVFRCGTGFDAAERASLWAERDALVGRTAKIKSFPIGVKDKPRHPVFLGWRDLAVDG